VTKIEVLNETAPKTNEDISLKLYLDNKSNIKVDYIIANSQRYEVSGGDEVNTVIIIIKALKMSGMMNIEIELMGYTINGVSVEQVSQDLI